MITTLMMRKWLHTWHILLGDRAFRISLFFGVIILAGAYAINYFANTYNDQRVYISVGDIILDHLPTYDLSFLFTYVFYATFILMFAYPIFFRPALIPFGLKTFGILIILRAVFILLTNIGPPIGSFYHGQDIGGNFIADFLFRNDLFFSGHTAHPYLAFWVFKESRIRWLFLIISILMAMTVLLMHIHYSIDVFAAFFIAYGVYRMSDRIFNKLYLRFKSRLEDNPARI